jgi:hypothetical protein
MALATSVVLPSKCGVSRTSQLLPIDECDRIGFIRDQTMLDEEEEHWKSSIVNANRDVDVRSLARAFPFDGPHSAMRQC